MNGKPERGRRREVKSSMEKFDLPGAGVNRRRKCCFMHKSKRIKENNETPQEPQTNTRPPSESEGSTSERTTGPFVLPWGNEDDADVPRKNLGPKTTRPTRKPQPKKKSPAPSSKHATSTTSQTTVNGRTTSSLKSMDDVDTKKSSGKVTSNASLQKSTVSVGEDIAKRKPAAYNETPSSGKMRKPQTGTKVQMAQDSLGQEPRKTPPVQAKESKNRRKTPQPTVANKSSQKSMTGSKKTNSRTPSGTYRRVSESASKTSDPGSRRSSVSQKTTTGSMGSNRKPQRKMSNSRTPSGTFHRVSESASKTSDPGSRRSSVSQKMTTGSMGTSRGSISTSRTSDQAARSEKGSKTSSPPKSRSQKMTGQKKTVSGTPTSSKHSTS